MPLERAIELLREGEIELVGVMPRASNYTFAATVALGQMRALAVYKPEAGESPLWDFPEGLWRREIAAYEVSEALGWGFVPPTVERDGPHGHGSLQLMIDADPRAHYLTLMPAHAETFRRVAAFDIVCNNADRKSGHCLLEAGTERIWVVDHGVCFHTDPKLRTVIWDFAGVELPGSIIADLSRFAVDANVRVALDAMLEPDEVEVIFARTRALLELGRFPDPDDDRRAVPWPPI